MKNSLKQRCDLFVKNKDILQNNFRWDTVMFHPLCASLYTEEGLEVDVRKIKLSKEIIKNNTAVFSDFRGSALLVLATMLSLDESSWSKFQKVIKAHEVLKSELQSSDYLPFTAFEMANMVETFQYERVARKARDIYVKMKNNHQFQNYRDDFRFAVMTAINDLPEAAAIDEMEKCYDLLNTRFAPDAAQALSNILILGEEAADKKCNRAMRIFDRLKGKNCKYGTGIELAVLGVLAMEGDNIDQAVNDISEVNEYLSKSKGFGVFGIGRIERIMYSAVLVADEYKKQCYESPVKKTGVNGLTSIGISKQAAITAVAAENAVAFDSNGFLKKIIH